MSISARLKAYLDENRVAYTLLSHTPVYTAQATAAVMHISGKEVAKTVVVRAGDSFALAVVPAACHVDAEKLSKVMGRPAAIATEPEFIRLFPDCELGAMPPFGTLYNLPVYADEMLAADEEIVFNAGTHRDAVRMRYADFAALAKPVVGAIATRG